MSTDDRYPKERLADPVAHRIRRLAGRLEAIGLFAPVGEREEKWDIRILTNRETGEIVPAVVVGRFTYWERGAELIAERASLGQIQWTRLGDDGEPIEPWRSAPPRPEDAVRN